jgi:hypothetical protein
MYPRAGGDEVDSVDVWRVDFAPLRALVAGPGVTFCPFCGDALIMRGGVYFCVRGSMDCSARLTEALTRLAPDGPPRRRADGPRMVLPTLRSAPCRLRLPGVPVFIVVGAMGPDRDPFGMPRPALMHDGWHLPSSSWPTWHVRLLLPLSPREIGSEPPLLMGEGHRPGE